MSVFKHLSTDDLDKGGQLAICKGLSTERKPRICMLTTRSFARQAFMCGFYEGQDVLLDIDDVDLIYLEPKEGYGFRRSLQEKMVWHDFTKMMVGKNLVYQPVSLDKEYDLFIVYLPFFQDLIHISAIQGWRDRCKTSICWINELWVRDIRQSKFEKWLPALDQFDHIALGLDATVNVLSDLLKRSCKFVPGGVDALRFSAYPELPARVIDIYSMGRSSTGLHESLLDFTQNIGMFYLYDTFNGSTALVRDYRQHREMLANIAKRTRYFVVSPAKKNIPDEPTVQIEVPIRYFEAAAAGTVLLGQAPECEVFHKMFNWPDAVIEISEDGSDTSDVLSKLAAQPDRLLKISRRNTQEALLRHDWVYRWKQILGMSGLSAMPKLELRENALKAMAEQINVNER